MTTVSIGALSAMLTAPDADFVNAESDPPEPLPRAEATSERASTPLRELAHAAVPAAAHAASESAHAPEVSAPAAQTAESTGPRFVMTVAPTIGVGAGAPIGQSGASGSVAGTAFSSSPVSEASADIPAKLRVGNTPSYTAAALAAGVEANVRLEIVVNESGSVTTARVLEPVGYGLDEAARQGVLAYRFTPAVRGGRPVAVRMHWLTRFQLR